MGKQFCVYEEQLSTPGTPLRLLSVLATHASGKCAMLGHVRTRVLAKLEHKYPPPTTALTPPSSAEYTAHSHTVSYAQATLQPTFSFLALYAVGHPDLRSNFFNTHLDLSTRQWRNG